MEEGERIESWKDFEEKVKKNYSEVEELKTKNGNGYVSTPLFRGQSDAKWELKSTLDRWKENFPVEEYHRIIQRIKSTVENCTTKRWQLTEDGKEVAKAIDGPSPNGNLRSDLEFMAYLRHTGFPSPLLDWTKCPYVALFFAFNEDWETDPAIFMYVERTNDEKTSTESARIWPVEEPNFTTHRRHYLQQCEYTYCIKGIDLLLYTSHEVAFSVNETESKFDSDYLNQDRIKKYTLPYDRRAEFLSKLNLRNINAYSLFETEEGLMNKLANEEFLYIATGKHTDGVVLR